MCQLEIVTDWMHFLHHASFGTMTTSALWGLCYANYSATVFERYHTYTARALCNPLGCGCSVICGTAMIT